MKAPNCTSPNLSNTEEGNKSKAKSGAKWSDAKEKEQKKTTTLVKTRKEEANTKQTNKKKTNPNGITKGEENSIDANKVEENIKKIEKSMNKLEEIEKKIVDDINECNKYIEVYEKAKTLLDSKDFDSDVGREEEIEEIKKILKRCSKNVDGEGIFLTGPSGQGKTYSIFYIIKEIEKEKEREQRAEDKKKKKENTAIENYKNIDASYFYVSCSNSQKPYDIFVDILQQIIKKDKKSILSTVKQKYNLNGLEEVKKVFINYTSKLSNLKIVIVDELDFIATKNVRVELKTKSVNKSSNEDVVKNLFECVQTAKSKIILVGIANSLDLIKDYTHMKINQIIYKPYNEKQFMSIVRNKLNTLEEEFVTKIFKGVSLNIHVRQISNRNGDIRSCFDAILRVFSDKKSDLDERKKNLIKLKEEVMMNKIFSRQEKRNLFLLLADREEDHSTDAMDGEESQHSESEQPDGEANRKGKRKATHGREDQANEGVTNVGTNQPNSPPRENGQTHRTTKKQKVEEKNTPNSKDQPEDNFFLEQNVTPLPSRRDFELANKFSDKAKNLKFTDQKNEFSIGYETLKKEVIKIQNNNETLSEILIRKNFNANDNASFYNLSQCTPKRCYESPFKVLYKNDIDSEMPHFKDKKEVLKNINMEKLHSFDTIVDNQIKSIEKKYHDFAETANNNTVMISDIKKITDKIPLEEHKDILFKIKSLPLIQKIYLYASCNVVNDAHLNSDDEEGDSEEKKQSPIQFIEITYADIQRGFRSLCSNLSETSYIRDILEGNTIDQAIEHFEELGILTNCKKNQKMKERKSCVKVPKGLTPRFANMKNNKNFSSQNKMNTVYYFNLPVCVIKQTLKEISSILSSFDRSGQF
ncbi:cell division control protein 6, putative [Plasmodium vivax]|nr:cell division control protein 6, putative [Plasmodium vivax]